MEVTTLAIEGIKLLTPRVVRDERGLFCETFSARSLAQAGVVATFVQDNYSMSLQKGVVRGLHFQRPPHTQGKLVRVTRGAIFDVALDIRRRSATFGRHVSVILSAANWRQIWIPAGFAHGFCTLEPDTEVVYKVTEYYAPDFEQGLRWDDPALAIAWPIAPHEAVLSPKDKCQPPWADLAAGFGN